MQFQVPQFTEQELKIVGPLTLKQFIFIGGGFIICVLLYKVLIVKSFLLFLMSATMVAVCALALAFLKVNGQALTTAISNFFFYLISPKSYFWKRKLIVPKLISVPKKEITKEKEKPGLKPSTKSQLEGLSTKLETGMK